jgi:putative salt-induced outer membrane protein YdiY
MKKLLLILTCAAVGPSAFADANPLNGLHNDSEGGVVITSGNASSQSYDLKQSDTYGWSSDLFKVYGKFLQTSAGALQTAKYWTVGARYEREFSPDVSGFVGQNLESDRFSGYLQRYNSDVGGKYFFLKNEATVWSGEAGYRYTIENRVGGQFNQNYLRFYSEANRNWTKTFSTKLWVEYLPNLTVTNDFQINSELSLSAALNDVFALKTAYLVKYRNLLIAPAFVNTDTQFTTALVAKF